VPDIYPEAHDTVRGRGQANYDPDGHEGWSTVWGLEGGTKL